MILDPRGRLEFQEFLWVKMKKDRFGTRPNGTKVRARLMYERVSTCIYSISKFDNLSKKDNSRESLSTRPFGTKVRVQLRSERVSTCIYSISKFDNLSEKSIFYRKKFEIFEKFFGNFLSKFFYQR